MTTTEDRPAVATTSQALVDQLVEEGYDGDAAVSILERIGAVGGLEIKDQPDDELLLTSDDVALIRHFVTGSPLAESTSLPCPSWCTEPAGHGFEPHETKDGFLVIREHVRHFGGEVEIACQEDAKSKDGPVDFLSEPLITVHDGGALNFREAMELAKDILDAVKFLLELETETTR